MVLGFISMLPDDYENLSQSVIATNFFGNNVLAAITTKNYWDVVNEYKPLMHTWYVGLVMQFYFVYPLLFFLAKLDKKNPQRTLLVLLSGLALVSIIIYFVTTDHAQRFYYLPSRFFEFAVGGILALMWKPRELISPLYKMFALFCYGLLILLMVVNEELLSPDIRLVVVVAFSAILIMSSCVLENKITGNWLIAKIGAASYSIFVWHQVALAFYRYYISNEFTVFSYTLFLISVAFLSCITYYMIEQKTSVWLKRKRAKLVFYTVTIIVFLGLNIFAANIYFHAGVVRDVPELYISKDNIHRGLHSEYNDKINSLNKPFETNKHHWLVIGNSFGRDFANVILESPVADSVEVSYLSIVDFHKPEYASRFATAEKVFLSTFSSLKIDESRIKELEQTCSTNGLSLKNLIIVGTKNFGMSNGQYYMKRFRKNYFEQRTKMEKGFAEFNTNLKNRFGEQYLDLIELVIDESGKVPVFTPDHRFISQDCRHFSKGGAVFFASLIDWNKYL